MNHHQLKFRTGIAITLLSLFFSVHLISNAQTNITLTGTVTDYVTGQPLVGATVHIKGTTHEVVTDEQGTFAFLTGQRLPVTYLVSYVGYQTTEATLTSGNHIRISLQPTNGQLNDVVVVGYGKQKRSDVTGSIASVSSKNLNQPTSSLDQVLKGTAPGIQVTQTSGQPGGGVSIRIRGGSSIQGGNEPLYVIDGFPVYNTANTSGAITGATINPLSAINPSDIESIDILKDASATAIYGSRGANGVIIVTTKKGRSEKSTITYDASYGVQSIVKKVDVLDAKGFAYLRNDVLFDVNPSPGKFQYLTQTQIDSLGKGTDWQGEAFRSVPIQNHQLSISGGNAKTRYLISGNYFNQDGIIKHTGFDRISGRANLDVVASSRLKVNANITASKTNADVAPSGIVSGLLTMPAVATIYEPNGSYTLRNPFENIFSNPIAALNEETNKAITTRLFATGSGEYTILNGLDLKILLGTDISSTTERSYIPSTIYEGLSSSGIASVGTIQSNSWLNENIINYNKKFGYHSLNVVAGFTQQEYTRDIVRTGAQQFVTNDLHDNSLQSGSTPQRPYSDNTKWVLHSYLGRINYNFNNRYFVTASLRADGSSRFGKGNKWGYFPSGALSWKISSEPFFKLQPFISDLKLRASFGETGNQEIGEYQSLATLASLTYLFGNNIVTGFVPNKLPNDKLGWETTFQYDAGTDIGLLKNRITLTLDAYYKKTENLLLNVEIPWTTGQTSVLQNFGSVENKGFEIGVSTRNFTKEFQWSTSGNISFNRNKVLSIGSGASSYISGNYIIKVGQPLGSFYGTVTDGILQKGEESTKGKYTGNAVPKPGDRLYKDINGDGIFTVAADRTIVGNAQPDYIFGIANDFSWKGFDLSVFVQGSQGNKILNANKQTLELFTGQQNASTSALQRWTPENPSTTIPRAKLDPAPVFSDRFIEDGTFVRLRTISFGYTIPQSIVEKIRLSKVRIYIVGQNLITWTNYTGFDPEVTSGSNISPGTDSGIYPIAKSISGGITINF